MPAAAPAPRDVTALADVLFTPLQRKLFRLLFVRPETSCPAQDLQLFADGNPRALARELERLTASGLVLAAEIGGKPHVRANPRSPVFAELCALVRKTVGLCAPLRDALLPLADVIDLALVHGAVARGEVSADGAIDLVVVADGLDAETLYWTLLPVENLIGRPVNAVLYTAAAFERRRQEPDSLVNQLVAGDPVVLLDGLCEW